MTNLTGKQFLIFGGNDYEDLELWYPKLRLIEAGARVIVAGLDGKGICRGKNGYPCPVDASVDDLSATDFLGVVLPGGWMPDKIRRSEKVKQLVRDFDKQAKVIAAICHGGWIAISANVYRGVRVTGSPGIKDDLINAGAHYEDSAVVIDRHHVSSRKPDDLPDFMKGIFQALG